MLERETHAATVTIIGYVHVESVNEPDDVRRFERIQLHHQVAFLQRLSCALGVERVGRFALRVVDSDQLDCCCRRAAVAQLAIAQLHEMRRTKLALSKTRGGHYSVWCIRLR